MRASLSFEHDYEHRPEKHWPKHEHDLLFTLVASLLQLHHCRFATAASNLRPLLREQAPAAESNSSHPRETWAGFVPTTSNQKLTTVLSPQMNRMDTNGSDVVTDWRYDIVSFCIQCCFAVLKKLSKNLLTYNLRSGPRSPPP